MEETFGHRLLRLRKAAGWNQVELARRVGVSPAQISALENDERKVGPTLPSVVAMADALGVTVDYLVRGDGPLAHSGGPKGHGPLPYSAPASFTMLMPTSAAGVPVARGLEPTPWVGIQMVPVVQQTIHGGAHVPDYFDPPALPVNVPHPGRYLAMRVVGECMVPDVEPGDIVIIDQEMAFRPDWVVALVVDGDQLLMRCLLRTPERWEFAPDNPALPALAVPANGVEVIGVVIARQKGPPVRRSPRRDLARKE